MIQLRLQWASPDTKEKGKVFHQKLRVTYLPAEGQVPREDEEDQEVSFYLFFSKTSWNGNVDSIYFFKNSMSSYASMEPRTDTSVSIHSCLLTFLSNLTRNACQPQTMSNKSRKPPM